jgi:hypothetical protein
MALMPAIANTMISPAFTYVCHIVRRDHFASAARKLIVAANHPDSSFRGVAPGGLAIQAQTVVPTTTGTLLAVEIAFFTSSLSPSTYPFPHAQKRLISPVKSRYSRLDRDENVVCPD